MMAQAVAEDCHMVTVDKVFSDYAIPVLEYDVVIVYPGFESGTVRSHTVKF